MTLKVNIYIGMDEVTFPESDNDKVNLIIGYLAFWYIITLILHSPGIFLSSKWFQWNLKAAFFSIYGEK